MVDLSRQRKTRPQVMHTATPFCTNPTPYKYQTSLVTLVSHYLPKKTKLLLLLLPKALCVVQELCLMACSISTTTNTTSSSVSHHQHPPSFYFYEKWKLSKKEGSLSSSRSSRSVSSTSKSSSSNRKCAFSRKCARLVKEQRARFYIMRRCVTMLICWNDYSDS